MPDRTHHDATLQAEEELRVSLEASPDDPQALLALARWLRAAGRPHAAAAHLQRAGKLSPPALLPALRQLQADLTPELEQPLLSVILVVDQDGAEWVRRVSQALALQVPTCPAFEVIILDTGRGTAVESLLRGIPAPANLRVLRELGATPGAALNLAIFAARGELLLFLDEDAIPAAQTIQRHAQVHLANWRRIAVLGSFPPTRGAQRMENARDVLRTSHGDPWSSMVPEAIFDWSFFWTCNLSLPRAALTEVGGFDEQLEDDVLLDLELGYRLMGMGYGTLFEPDIPCSHDHHLHSLRYLRQSLHRNDDHQHLLAKHGRLFARDEDPQIVRDPVALQRLESAVHMWETRARDAQGWNRQAIIVNLEGALRAVHWPTRRIQLPHLVERTCRAVGAILEESGMHGATVSVRRMSRALSSRQQSCAL